MEIVTRGEGEEAGLGVSLSPCVCLFVCVCVCVCEKFFFKLFLELVIKKKEPFCIGVRHAVSFSI